MSSSISPGHQRASQLSSLLLPAASPDPHAPTRGSHRPTHCSHAPHRCFFPPLMLPFLVCSMYFCILLCYSIFIDRFYGLQSLRAYVVLFVVDTCTTRISSSSSTTLDLEMTVSLLQQLPLGGCCRLNACQLLSRFKHHFAMPFLGLQTKIRRTRLFFWHFSYLLFLFFALYFLFQFVDGSQPIFLIF